MVSAATPWWTLYPHPGIFHTRGKSATTGRGSRPGSARGICALEMAGPVPLTAGLSLGRPLLPAKLTARPLARRAVVSSAGKEEAPRAGS